MRTRHARLVRHLVVVVATSALGACANGVTVQRADGVVIPENATYAWATPSSQTSVAGQGDLLVGNDIVHARLQAEIDTVLARHGWRPATPDSSRFLVRYSIGRRMERSTYTTTNYGYGAVPVLRCGFRRCWSDWGWGVYGAPLATTHAYSYPEGTLLVDIVERTSGHLVWRGIGTEQLDAKDLEPARLQKEVARILQSLPGHAATA
ncbi:MAG: DUF4136 domain-containing protein [Gemmatimonadaceae bacterium]|jgi:hypothetical protein|nr:DUF4136 domain-containing protein [Gemmatimonadaceae bacterium]